MSSACKELTLRTALADPLIRTLMAADKVDPAQLESMLQGIADQVARRPRPAPRREDAYACWA